MRGIWDTQWAANVIATNIEIDWTNTALVSYLQINKESALKSARSWASKMYESVLSQVKDMPEFFHLQTIQGKSQEITPARLTKEQEDKVNVLAKKVYEILKMKGFSRSEFIFKDGEPHLLEMNTIPGLTLESILPQQAAAANITLSDLFDNAIEEALR